MIEQIQFVRIFGVAKIDNLLQEMLLGGMLMLIRHKIMIVQLHGNGLATLLALRHS